ncbi:hypothetical protein N7456_008717 [Penicillium angulare]|uniref:Uncharacterized protein n=1 Tax=Penicillium angulare TaxID=116970 RepID=A0A9W9F3D4_9EURO|nr:hypothetical protein N7456_008717 [Penicillium angulare]
MPVDCKIRSLYREAKSKHTNCTTVKPNLDTEVAELLKNVISESRLSHHPIVLEQPCQRIHGDVGPARAAHLDRTPIGANNYLHEKIPHEDAVQLSKAGRTIVNVWRPLKAVKRDPLAICDGNTPQPGNLMPIQMDYSSNARAKALGEEKGLNKTVRWEITMDKYNDGQKWYYLFDMGEDEALLMRIFHSDLAGGLDEGRVAVHSSFETKDGDVRESIEFRCFVFWPNEPLKS